MNNYEYGNICGHVNAFVDMNGIPYLLAEYLDRNIFQQVDRSAIKSQLVVDQNDAMRAVVDISIDDIGKRSSDGYPAIVGNNSKMNNLIKMISDNRTLMEAEFNVLRRGIVVRVDYQLENYRTGQVIRSMTENFRILDRNYFLDINPRDVNDNAIIVNFCNTMVSTINEFTHGQDPMMIRITNVHMSYEMVKPNVVVPQVKQSMTGYPNQIRPGTYGMDPNNLYQYHNSAQNQHYLNGYDPVDYNRPTPGMPIVGYTFNRFYHFDNGARDIVLHAQEINDNNTKVALIPCGTVRINRTFMINPGHRIIFKFSIWKNDVTVVNDTTPIAQALRPQNMYDDMYGDGHNCQSYPIGPVQPPMNCGCNQNINSEYDAINRKLDENRKMDYQQNRTINQLNETVAKLSKYVQRLGCKNDGPNVDCNPDEDVELNPVIPFDPPKPPKPNHNCCHKPKPPKPDCDCEDVHNSLSSAINAIDDEVDTIQDNVDKIQDELDDIPDLKPLSNEDIDAIISEIDELTDPQI